jgi:hypothetical protein
MFLIKKTKGSTYCARVFTNTSPKRSFSLNRKRAFWLVFAKTGARMQRPSFGHENQRFRENQPKTIIFIPNHAQRPYFQRVLKR